LTLVNLICIIVLLVGQPTNNTNDNLK
jgi:hypothetical protein